MVFQLPCLGINMGIGAAIGFMLGSDAWLIKNRLEALRLPYTRCIHVMLVIRLRVIYRRVAFLLLVSVVALMFCLFRLFWL